GEVELAREGSRGFAVRSRRLAAAELGEVAVAVGRGGPHPEPLGKGERLLEVPRGRLDIRLRSPRRHVGQSAERLHAKAILSILDTNSCRPLAADQAPFLLPPAN